MNRAELDVQPAPSLNVSSPKPDLRIAILADIHGNRQALDAVLADVRAQGADRVIVNGDLVNRGPDSVAVVETLLGSGADLTLGNHDGLMRLWQTRDPDLPAGWFADPFWGATEWSVRQLERAGLLDVIGTWPMTAGIEVPGAPPILVAHGTPSHYRESLGHFTPQERLDELLSPSQSGVLVGSHTHRPFERRAGGRLWLNTGAVGAPFNDDPRAQYLLLDLVAGQWYATFRAVPYDRAPTLRAFETSGLLRAGDVSAEIFRDEVALARSLYTPFWDWAERGGRVKDWAAWRDFRAAHPERFRPD